MRLLANIANATDCKRLKRFWVLEIRRDFNVTFFIFLYALMEQIRVPVLKYKLITIGIGKFVD